MAGAEDRTSDWHRVPLTSKHGIECVTAMTSRAEQAGAATRSGEVLFSVSVFLAVAIYLLNTSLAERRQLIKSQFAREAFYTEIVERYRSFKAKDAALFQNLALASIEIAYHTPEYEKKYPTLVRSVPTGGHSRSFLPLSDERVWKITEYGDRFGEKAARAFALSSIFSERVDALATAVSDEYQGDPEVALFLRSEVITRFAALDAANEWDRIAWWIAYGTWPQPIGSHVDIGPGVTFGQRVKEEPSEFSRRFHVYQLLLFAPDPSTQERELFDLWKQSYAEQATSAIMSQRLAIPMVGLSISADAVVGLAAPILLVLQFMFLMHWEHRATDSEHRTERYDVFPSYGSPDDPLEAPAPRTLSDVVRRSVWALFLLFPTLLFAIGVLTRYDIVYPIGYFGGYQRMTMFAAELQARSKDLVSDVLDWVTFTCMIMSVFAVFIITNPRISSSAISPDRRRVGLIWLAAAVSALTCVSATVVAFEYYVAPLANASDVNFQMHYLAGFGVFWSAALGVSLTHRARFLMALAIAGLALFVCHFIPL
jgi:hypothetical protein